MTRINKYLAECGVCSRREADRLVEQGRVKINGQLATTGSQVQPEDVVEVNGKTLQQKTKKVVLAYYKPVGVTCTEHDKHAKLPITKALNYKERLTYAGRLDQESEGLMIMTNDGALIQKMVKASQYHEKEYLVKVQKEITEDFLTGMSQGVYLKELDQTTRPCKVEKVGKYTFRIILTQGLNRQIRRMCQSFGYQVKELKRVRVVNIELGKLKSGEYREVTGEEKEKLYQLCGMQQEHTARKG